MGYLQSYTFQRKCEWGLSATSSPFAVGRAAEMHQCIGVAAAKVLAAASVPACQFEFALLVLVPASTHGVAGFASVDD